MSSSATTLPEILAVLRLFWQRQDVACPPASLPYVQEVAAANGVVLPPDFEQMYCTVNGTPELYPNYLDKHGFSMLPVEALLPEHREFLVIEAQTAVRERLAVMVFVDYMHRSWWYGFVVDANGETYRIGIMPTNGVFKVLTTSLTEFLQWYVEDADALYDSDYTFDTPL